MRDILPHLEKLATCAQPSSGGWGYGFDTGAHPEPTCLALLALRLDADRFSEAIKRGCQALERHAVADGSYRLYDEDDKASWPTSHVLFVKASLGFPPESFERSATYLLNLEGQTVDDPEAGQIHDIDIRLPGWPWSERTFSWVEPTAWACLALRRTGFGKHPRVEKGVELLLDRAFPEGGLNYGLRHVFGQTTEPMPGPTAIALIALQTLGSGPRVIAALEYLHRCALESEDLGHLCWAKLALDVYGRDLARGVDFATLDERIRSVYRRSACDSLLSISLICEALAALALAPSRLNPFHLADSQITVNPVPGEVSRFHPRGWHDLTRSAFKGLLVEAAARPLKTLPTRVHIAEATRYDETLIDLVAEQYAFFRERVPLTGKCVVLKPNLVEYHQSRPINTHPAIICAAIALCRREGAAEVIVAEGPGHRRDARYLVAASGLGEVLKKLGVPFIDLNHDEPMRCLNMGRQTGLDYLYLARTVATADVLISLPKLKTHHWAGVTLSLKNLFGIVPGICYGWPKNELHWRGIENSIVDIALTREPDLAIVDGIVGMEGDGPINGRAKPVGVVIMGCDPVAVDATCCRLMGLDPERVEHLALATKCGLGTTRVAEIEQVGACLSSCARSFETLPRFRHLRLNVSAEALAAPYCPEPAADSGRVG